MGRVWLLVKFVVLLVKMVFVGVLIACVVVRDRVVSELSHNNEGDNRESPETAENNRFNQTPKLKPRK